MKLEKNCIVLVIIGLSLVSKNHSEVNDCMKQVQQENIVREVKSVFGGQDEHPLSIDLKRAGQTTAAALWAKPSTRGIQAQVWVVTFLTHSHIESGTEVWTWEPTLCPLMVIHFTDHPREANSWH